METEYNYICEKCHYKTNIQGSYKAHLKTTLHRTGKRKERKDKQADIYKCKKCDYETTSCYNYKVHKLNNHSTIEERKKGFKYYCKKCNFGVFTKTSYNLHKNTKKHKNKTT